MSAGTGLQVSVTPEFTNIDLFPAAPSAVGSPFHRIEPPKGPVVTVSSKDGKAHKVRLRIEGSTGEWRSGWTRWVLIKRKSRELEGGDALDVQDQVEEEGRDLTAMILADETRTFHLETTARLDGATNSGTYAFDVVAQEGDSQIRCPAYLTLRHPSSSLLAQLPSVYLDEVEKMRRDEDGESPFFERFLLGFEDAMRPLRQTLDGLDKLFGPYTTPPEALLWLGAWTCLPLDENWTEMQRRRMIREAVELYRWRGTRRGLSRYLEIYTGVKPEIDDQPVKGMRLGSRAKMGAPETKLGDIPPHTFVVTLALSNRDRVNEQVIDDIVAYEKPAHTAYTLRIVRRTG